LKKIKCAQEETLHMLTNRELKLKNQNISMGAYWRYALAHNNMLEIFLF